MADANGNGNATQKANTSSFIKLYNFLKAEKTKECYDEANPDNGERAAGLKQPKNDNRNANN